MSLATVKPQLKRAAQVQAAFPDHWALLNASSEEIRHRTEGYPAEEVEDLVSLLDAFLQLYLFAAWGWARRFGEAPLYEVDEKTLLRTERPLTGKEKQLAQNATFGKWADLVTGLLGKYGFLPELCLQRGKVGPELELRAKDPVGKLFPVLEGRISRLLTDLLEANESTVFVCENCGRIGPAERSDKRYCSNVCRAQASRRRRR